jgi:hypothetical protein
MIVLGKRLSLVSGLNGSISTRLSKSDRKEGDERGTGTTDIVSYGLAPNV